MSFKKKNSVEDLIQDYLLEEGLLRERLPDPNSKFDFGFVFSFPPGPKGQKMSSFKPRNKNYILIAIRTQISKSQIKIMNSLEDNKKIQFFNDLRKLFLIKEIFFQIDIENNRYEINDNLYFDRDGYISKDAFFKTIRKIFYCYILSQILISEYCSGKEELSKKFNRDFDLPFYT